MIEESEPQTEKSECPLCFGQQRIVDGAGDSRPCECAPTEWDREIESYVECDR